MILDDYDVPTPQSDVQVRNAYAAAAWRLQYERRAACPDPRDFDQQCRGALNAKLLEQRREEARHLHAALLRERERARQRALQAQFGRLFMNVVHFPRRDRR